MQQQANVPVVFTQWEAFVGWLLERTQKLPRRLRFTFVSRIDNLALDVFELLVEARYTRQRAPILRRVNLNLEKLRLLLRLVHDQGHLDRRAFAHAVTKIDEVGRMVGGWLRYADRRR
ncbi:MAG: diversity-generating retroelement protein Avd [Acidobacteriota bacterium]